MIQSDESGRGAFRDRARRHETNGGDAQALQGSKVLLVYSPEYRAMQTLTTNRIQVFKRFHELTDRFGAPLFGTTAVRQFRLDEKTFITPST